MAIAPIARLSATQARILLHVALHPSSRVEDIAKAMGLPRGQLYAPISRLQCRGYLRATHSSEWGRGAEKVLRVTDEGMARVPRQDASTEADLRELRGDYAP